MKTSDINTTTPEGKLLLDSIKRISENENLNTDCVLDELLNNQKIGDDGGKLKCPCSVVLSMFSPESELPEHCTCDYIIKMKNEK